ncbi:MAG: hypothetical protein ACR2PO_07020, partial [Methyloligellaceae bacterium]
DLRRGLVDHKWIVTTSSGREIPAFGGPIPPIGVVAKLARCTGIAQRSAPNRMSGLGSIK